MVSKKAIIGVVAVVAIIAIAAIAIGGSSEKEPNARYNYTLELSESFGSGSGMIVTPQAGYQFAILHYRVANDSYDGEISTNPLTWVWKVIADGVSYTDDFETYSHPDYKLVSVVQGGQAEQCLVYQVPTGIGLSDVTVSQEYTWTFNPPLFKQDPSLTV